MKFALQIALYHISIDFPTNSSVYKWKLSEMVSTLMFQAPLTFNVIVVYVRVLVMYSYAYYICIMQASGARDLSDGITVLHILYSANVLRKMKIVVRTLACEPYEKMMAFFLLPPLTFILIKLWDKCTWKIHLEK